mgnify:CR=1 FL=1
MKKFVSFLLLFICLFSHTGTAVWAAFGNKNSVIKSGISKNVKREIPKRKKYQPVMIEDEAVNELSSVKKNKVKYKEQIVADDTLATLPAKTKSAKRKYKNTILNDEKIVFSENEANFKRPVYTGKFKTENGVAVMLKPVGKISTKNSKIVLKKGNKSEKYNMPYPYIGDRVAFKVVNDVKKDGQLLIAKDTIVYAKIAEVSPRAMGGAPAEMTIESFEMYDKKGNLVPLDGQIASSGYSLSFWIGLAELATTPFLFGLAVPLLRLLPGGQAVISPRKNYVVYY